MYARCMSQRDISSTLCEVLGRAKDKRERAMAYYGDLYRQLYLGDQKTIRFTGETPLDLIMVREDGSYIQPRTMQHASSIIHYEIGLKDFTFHSLRHTHATMLAENDAPPKYVKERLGHKNIQVTLQYYQHLTERITQKGNFSLELLSKNLLPSQNKWQQNGNKP